MGQSRQKEFVRANARARALRKDQTPSEKKLWRMLQQMNKHEDARFRRQVAIDAFVYDFGDFAARLLIEMDGAAHVHDDVQQRDIAKRIHAERNAFKLLRLSNADVWERPDWTLDQVRAFRSAPHPQPPLRKGEGDESA